MVSMAVDRDRDRDRQGRENRKSYLWYLVLGCALCFVLFSHAVNLMLRVGVGRAGPDVVYKGEGGQEGSER